MSSHSRPDTAPAPKPEKLAVVVGAMRAGTTTLFQMLQQTGLVCLSRIKEPDFFIAGKSAYRGEGWYAGLYEDLSKVCVDISPNYAKNDVFPGVARAIHAFNPQARIIYVVRDPVERAISEYFHQQAAGVEMPPPAEFLSTPQGAHALSTSSYGKQIADYYALFPADQILIVDMDALVKRPSEEVAKLLSFIGAPAPESLTLTAEVTNDRGSLARMPKFWLSLRRTRAGDWIRGAVPPSLHARLKALGTAVSRRREVKAEPFPASVKDEIRARLSDDLAVFETYAAGVDLAWLRRSA